MHSFDLEDDAAPAQCSGTESDGAAAILSLKRSQHDLKLPTTCATVSGLQPGLKSRCPNDMFVRPLRTAFSSPKMLWRRHRR